MTKTGESTFDTTQFSSHAAELNRLLNTFSEKLDQEANAIKQNLPEDISAASNAKNELVNQLNTLSEKIDSALSQHDLNLNTLIESELFTTLPTALQEQIIQALELIEKCHDKNLANGMSIQMLSNINKHALDLIAGKPTEDVKLYGSSGEKTRSSGQSSLGKA